MIAVLVHGAGHTAAVWRDTQAAMAGESVAFDLPGRGAHPADITAVTVSQAADVLAADVEATVDGDVVLVGHSVAGMILPSAAARLDGRVRHLVYVAGIAAPEGVAPWEVFMPDRVDAGQAMLDELRAAHAGQTVESLDVRTASSIDSLNLCAQPMTWAGLPASVPRTFVRCLRDPIQSREVQARFAAHLGAQSVVDIDSGHTPAIDAPVTLAEILDGIVAAASEDAARGRGAPGDG